MHYTNQLGKSFFKHVYFKQEFRLIRQDYGLVLLVVDQQSFMSMYAIGT